MSDLSRRVITALVLAPLVIGAVWVGGWAFILFLVAAAVIVQSEVFGLCEAAGLRPLRPLGYLAGALIVIAPLWAGALPLATVALIALIAAELYRREERPLGNAAAGVLAAFYPAALVAWVGYLRIEAAAAPGVGEAGAAWLTATALVAIWAADSFAYFAGRSIGRTPLFPRVSPKKTVEGMFGGVVGAIVLTVILKVVAMPFLGWSDAVVIGVLAGALGPIGDLAASLFKRSVGVKDSGQILPGHGGLLDRVDAALFVVPLIAFYLDFIADVF